MCRGSLIFLFVLAFHFFALDLILMMPTLFCAKLCPSDFGAPLVHGAFDYSSVLTCPPCPWLFQSVPDSFFLASWHRPLHLMIILFFLSCRFFFLVVPFVRLFSNVVHSLLCTVFATSYEFVNVVILTTTSLFICSHCRFEHHILCLDLSKIMGVAHA